MWFCKRCGLERSGLPHECDEGNVAYERTRQAQAVEQALRVLSGTFPEVAEYRHALQAMMRAPGMAVLDASLLQHEVSVVRATEVL